MRKHNEDFKHFRLKAGDADVLYEWPFNVLSMEKESFLKNTGKIFPLNQKFWFWAKMKDNLII